MTDSTDDFHYAEDYPLAPLEDDCRLLGALLDDCLRIEIGEEHFHKVERLRTVGICATELSQRGDTKGSTYLSQQLYDELSDMDMNLALPLIRACSHYLNFTGIAELHHRVRRSRAEGATGKSCEEVFSTLLQKEGISSERLYDVVANQNLEIVLTAHPTQVVRRTLQYKHAKIAALLGQNDRADLTPFEKESVIEDLIREVAAVWQTEELRRNKPTVLDEARGGLHIVEQSLWAAVPAFMRRVSESLRKYTGKELPLTARILSFGSWMGGDRDGNPNVTAQVTYNVACLARWMAADLYLQEIDALRLELSMSKCSYELNQLCREIVEEEYAASDEVQGKNIDAQNSIVGLEIGASDFSSGPTIEAPSAESVNNPFSLSGASVIQVVNSENRLSELAEGLSGDMTPTVATEEAKTDPPSYHLSNISKGSKDSLSGASDVEAQGQTGARKKPQKMGKSRSQKAIVDKMLHPVGGQRGYHPYRIVLGSVRQKLLNTKKRMEDRLSGQKPADDDDWYENAEDLARPLMACYRSLVAADAISGKIIASGRLIDILRRVHVFGVNLMKMDIRQEASRHTAAMDEVTQFLGYGSYMEWDESKRIEFLTKELYWNRPLIPTGIVFSENVKEVINTFRVVAELGTGSLGAYVISMASAASDVLAVELLQHEARLLVSTETGQEPDHSNTLRVVPLFETLSDLDGAGDVIDQLFSTEWYRKHLRDVHNDHQEIMLGYSDSGKDAGRLAASWALYKCQEKLVEVSKKHGIRLTLFHGRGGSIGRGGGPMNMAIQSQPPGSVGGSLRMTEQGEMIQAKFGIPGVAQNQLELCTTAVLLATLSPPRPPRSDEWRSYMDVIGQEACSAYRNIIRDPIFLDYFRHATPESELSNLNIASRPTRRRKGGGIETLRAIPWIFAWTQTRLVLPSWLGIGDAIEKGIKDGKLEMLRAMYNEWSFFQSTIDLIEMVLAKADERIASLYDDGLVSEPAEKELGAKLRANYRKTVECVQQLTGHTRLCENNPSLRRLIEMRNPYIDPINMLQVQILKRLRREPNSTLLREALMITINGIAAGMRNTG